MNPTIRLWSIPSLQQASRVMAALVVSVGCLVLIGWLLDISSLKQVFPGLVSMKANVALGFILAGTALFLLTQPVSPALRWIRLSCSLMVMGIGAATLSQYLFGWDLGIDQLIFAEDLQAVGTSMPGRMSPLSATSFTLIGLALWFSILNQDHPKTHYVRWIESCSIITELIALQVIVAYLYQVQPIIGLSTYTQMALHTALCFIGLASGILMAHSHRGLMSLVIADSIGGTIVRRLLPAAIAIPLVLGWLRMTSDYWGLMNSGLSTSILVVLYVTILTGLILWTAQQLHDADVRRQVAAAALAQTNNALEARIEARTIELQDTNERLRESEERLSLAIEGAGMGTWDMNLETGQTFWSAQYFRLLGYEPTPTNEATQDMWQSQIHPDDLPRVLQATDRARWEQTLYYPEYRILRADDGRVVWLRVFGRFLYNAAGQAVRFVGILFDDTERKQTQEERDRFFSLSLDMMCIAGEDGYFKQINPAWEQTLGYTQAELLAEPYVNLIHPDDRQATQVEACNIASGLAATNFENRYRTKDGSYRWLSWTSVLSAESGLTYAIARDVTARKQSDHQLAGQAQILKQQADLLELTYEAIVVRDAHGAITYWNRGAEAMYGWTRNEAIGQVSHTLLHTQLPEPGNLDQIVAEKFRWQGELVHTRRDGQEIIAESRQVVIQNDQGNPAGFLEVNRDITDRKHNEQAQQRLAKIVENSPDFIATTTMTGQMIYLNPAGRDLVGLSTTAPMTEFHATDFHPPEYEDVLEQQIMPIMLKQGVWQGESLLRHCQTGELIPVHQTAFINRDRHTGQPLSIATVIRDMRERKQAEQALKASLKDLADFKFALDQSSIVAITNAQGTITYVNDKFCQLSQYTPAELIGQNHRLINSGYHPQSFFQQMWGTISQGQVWRGEIRNRAKDGTCYWVATTIVPFLDSRGKPYQYIAVRSDITSQKAAEAELQQLNTTLEQRVDERTVQLQEANKDLEAFSYTIAHDLRAPLRGIKGFAQALVEDYDTQLDALAKEYIQYIVEGTDRMNALVHDLLAYSRLSREQIRLTPVHLTQVVAEAQAQLDADLRDRKANVYVAPNLPSVLGQRPILVQMVANLLSNAMKFIAPDLPPQIQIWADWVETPTTEAFGNGTRPGVPRVRLWVKDNGIGIAPGYQEQIFGVFERLHGVEAYSGTGIGLAIVRKGAERLGGRAGVESVPGQGSRFWVELQGVQ